MQFEDEMSILACEMKSGASASDAGLHVSADIPFPLECHDHPHQDHSR